MPGKEIRLLDDKQWPTAGFGFELPIHQESADRGFHVIIVADACTTLDPGSAEAVQILFGRVWSYVMQTDDVIAWLTTGEAPKRTRLPA
jgi:hypothetical protein